MQGPPTNQGGPDSGQESGKTLWIGDVEPWMNETHIAG